MPNVNWFEDFDENFEHWTGSRTITEADIVFFSTYVGLHEGLFLSVEDAKKYPFGQRVSPGIMTLALAEGLTFQSRIFYGSGLVFLGIKETKMIAPVLINDTIRVRVRAIERKAKPEKERGAVTFQHDVFNQRDEPVVSYKIARIVAMKDGKASLLRKTA